MHMAQEHNYKNVAMGIHEDSDKMGDTCMPDDNAADKATHNEDDRHENIRQPLQHESTTNDGTRGTSNAERAMLPQP